MLTHTSRTKTILSNNELLIIAELIKSKSKQFNKPQIYLQRIGNVNNDGMIPSKERGFVNAYLWDRKIGRGSMSTNITVSNGYEDPLFDKEDKVEIFYEIFPSASNNARSSEIFNNFKTVQRIKRAKNYSETKSAIIKIMSEISRRS
jgi:hypothetical protein